MLTLLRTPAHVNDDVMALLRLMHVKPADDRLATVNAALLDSDWLNAHKGDNTIRDGYQDDLPNILPLLRSMGFLRSQVIGASTGSYAIIPGGKAEYCWTVVQTALSYLRSCLTGYQPHTAYLLGSSVRHVGYHERLFLRQHDISLDDRNVTEAEMLRMIWEKQAAPCFHRPIQRHCLEHGCVRLIQADCAYPLSRNLVLFRALQDVGSAQFAPGLVSLFSDEPFGPRLLLEFRFVFGQEYNVNLIQHARGDDIVVVDALAEFARYLFNLEIEGYRRGRESDLAGLAAWEAMR